MLNIWTRISKKLIFFPLLVKILKIRDYYDISYYIQRNSSLNQEQFDLSLYNHLLYLAHK